MCITTPKQESFIQTGKIYKKSQDTSINVPLKNKYLYIIHVILPEKKLESKHRMYVSYITDQGVHSPFGVPCGKYQRKLHPHVQGKKVG